MTDAIRLIQRSLFPVSIVFTVSIIALVYSTLGMVTAIKGSYVLIGLLAAVGFTRVFSIRETVVGSEFGTKSTWYGKLCWVILIASFAVTVFRGDRSFVLAFSIPVAYALIILQVWDEAGIKLLLPQVIGVYSLSTVTKYATTGYYFGEGDILDHLYLIEVLVRNGFVSAIPSATYRFFPGLHIQTAIVETATGLPTYDSLIILGITIYSISLVLVYLLSSGVFRSPTLAVVTTIVVSALPDIVFYGVYFFPQSYAVVVGLFIVYFSVRAPPIGSARRIRFVTLSALLALSMVFIHHFTFVLFLPIIAVLVSGPLIEKHASKVNKCVTLVPIQSNFLLAPLLLALVYWFIFDLFFGEIIHAITVMIVDQTLLVGDTGHDTGLHTLGYELHEQTSSLAVMSLLSYEGVFAISLMATFVFGIRLLLENFDEHIYQLPFLLIGVSGAVLVFPLPIDLTGRIGQPMNYFLAFVMAIAVCHLIRSSASVPLKRVVVVVVVVALTTSGHFVAADDVYEIDDGPGLNELYLAPDAQAEFNTHEHRSLESASGFTEAHGANVSTDWVSSSGVQRFGGAASDGLAIANSSFRTNTNHLLYRTRWSEHQVYFNTTESQFYISQERLEYVTSTENQVYATGEVGILWEESPGIAFGERSTSTNTD